MGDQIIYLKTNFKSKEFYDNGLWKLTINIEKRGKSKLENPQTNNLELYVDFLSACINHIQEKCDIKNTTKRNTRKKHSTIIKNYLQNIEKLLHIMI